MENNDQFAKVLSETFNNFFKDIIVPYVDTMGLIAQKATVNFIQKMLEITDSKEQQIEFLKNLDKCYEDKINELNKVEKK